MQTAHAVILTKLEFRVSFSEVVPGVIMQKQYQRQLSTDQLKVREISQEYLKVEQNTQPLTQLVRFSFRAKHSPLSGKFPLDLRSFFCLIIQTCYLLYACQLRKMNLWLISELLGRPPKKGELIPLQEVYMEYILGKQFDRMRPEQQQGVTARFKFVQLTKSQHSFGDFMCDFILKIKNVLRGPLQRARNSPDNFYVRQMEGLVFIIQNYVLAQVKSISPKAFILCLQESQAFRDYSVLLKCFNNSLFASLRLFPQCPAVFRELMRIEQKLSVAAQQKRDFSENVKRVEMTIEQSFKFLLKHKIIASELSLTQSSGQSSKGKEYTMGQVEGHTVQSRKYAVRVYVKQTALKKFSGQTLETIMERLANLEDATMELDELREQKEKKLSQGLKEQDKTLKSEYVVQYYSHKNLVCVKYVTNIELNIENTDVLMFHCNYMSYLWHSVTLEFAEKITSKNKKKERVIVFKTVTYLTLQDRVIFKIFAMIDLIMVHAKIVEPHLRKNIFNLDDYHSRNAELNLQCEHVKQIFIKKIERTYRALTSP